MNRMNRWRVKQVMKGAHAAAMSNSLYLREQQMKQRPDAAAVVNPLYLARPQMRLKRTRLPLNAAAVRRQPQKEFQE